MATANEAAAMGRPMLDRAVGETTLAELLATLPPDQTAAIDRYYRELREAVLATLSPEAAGSTVEDTTGSPPIPPTASE